MAPSPHVDVRVLFAAEEIAARVDALARAIAAEGLEKPLVVSVLKGGFVYTADLVRALHRAGVATEVTFLALSSYGRSTKSSGTITVKHDIDTDVAGRDIILVEDLLDTGRTVAFAIDLLRDRGARRVVTTAIVDKPGRREVDVVGDHIGFVAPDVFVVGYGID
ncbi:MAG: hypoxanthine phosphoribosyltransferase, partial [Hyphomicrobiales bacterium]|nr:hypoxanthine phosphoribosyltransferase [Hyphomicrobiales bacterium]